MFSGVKFGLFWAVWGSIRAKIRPILKAPSAASQVPFLGRVMLARNCANSGIAPGGRVPAKVPGWRDPEGASWLRVRAQEVCSEVKREHQSYCDVSE